MLFNSYPFIFLFLPVVFGGFLALSARSRQRGAAAWLALASLFFYGYWAPRYLLLLLASIAFNYLAGRAISRRAGAGQGTGAILFPAVAANLLLLAYYKYANFLLDGARALTGLPLPVVEVILPIGISFFTFTQIAFLVDCHEGKVRESDPVHYLLFVSYFPHLIAGPVLHHGEMMPQFRNPATYGFQAGNFTLGLLWFASGLFKKVVLADGIQPYVAPVFAGEPSHFFAAWGGALAYTLQIYFDFSGYSDMAVGLSRLFNIELPLNFNSPYQARNISDFWRRWHMTLSRFLRDYLYIRLGGNRRGARRRHLNLLATMVLGGLWHGAGWTFVIWGGLHGLYLAANHAWAAAWAGRRRLLPGAVTGFLARALTFLSVVVAWVFFRAATVDEALQVLAGMAGCHGLVFPGAWEGLFPAGFAVDPDFQADGRQLGWTLALLALAWFCPNTQTVLGAWQAGACRGRLRAAGESLQWLAVGACSSLVMVLALINGSRGASEFIYFNF